MAGKEEEEAPPCICTSLDDGTILRDVPQLVSREQFKVLSTPSILSYTP
jgi:hypothetical protein